VLLYNGPLLCDFNVDVKGLTTPCIVLAAPAAAPCAQPVAADRRPTLAGRHITPRVRCAVLFVVDADGDRWRCRCFLLLLLLMLFISADAEY